MLADVHILSQFNLSGKPTELPGGSQSIFRVDGAVLKQIKETSLENNNSPRLAEWISEFSNELQEDGFRLPKPIATTTGGWITDDGWIASAFVQGRHACTADIPSCIEAIAALHQAIQHIPPHPLMATNQTPWGQADRWCWGERPDLVQPELRELIEHLYALRAPISGLKFQLIHGDLNPGNILIAPDMPPTFIDFSPFWGPPEFALAIFANFIGPRRGDISILTAFRTIKHFDQLLIRAAIRMLLVMSVTDSLNDWDCSTEKEAAELIIAYLTG